MIALIPLLTRGALPCLFTPNPDDGKTYEINSFQLVAMLAATVLVRVFMFFGDKVKYLDLVLAALF